MPQQHLQMASVELPGTARPELGLGAIRRGASPFGPELSVDGKQTLWELFEASAATYADRPCLGRRAVKPDGSAGDFEFISYGDALRRSVDFGCGLRHLQLCPANSDGLVGLGFFSRNRREFLICDMGCHSQSIVPVPMYDTLEADTVEYVVTLTEISTVLCTQLEMDRVCVVAQKQPQLLRNVVLLDGADLSAEALAAVRSQGANVGLKVLTMGEVEDAGRAHPCPRQLPRGNDVAFFCFTSGTTGNPKAAEVKHSGMISCLVSLLRLGLDIKPDDIHLSYLPLPHVFERGITYSMLHGGGRIGYFRGDSLLIVEDLLALRPTVFPSVPRLLNRIHDKLRAGVAEAGGVKQWLFETALSAKLAGLERGQLKHPIWDALVFKGVKAKVGLDRVRLMFTGSAPLSGSVMSFFRAVFGCPLVEGYGQTECSLLATLSLPNDLSTGHVGAPAPCCEIRLVSVPEMEYLVQDTAHSDGMPCLGRGEIWIRGANNMHGYYRMPEKTASTIDADGWIKTGDIGLFTLDGKLRIVDRKNNVLKLSQGEYVALESVENVLARHPLVLQIFVFGSSLESSLVAVIVPDPEALAARGLQATSAEAKELMQGAVQQASKEAKLRGFEIPKAVHVCANELNALPERDGITTVLTPTFKLARNKARDYFKPELDAMYAEINSRAKL